MGKSAKRFYQFTYQDTNEPVYVEDAGNLLKISGILLQGMGTNILVLTPQANDIAVNTPQKYSVDVVRPFIEEWSEIIRRTDDPLWFEKDETGMTKAVHRKVRMAISGVVQQRIWVRDGFQCLFCGRRMGEVQLTVDHFMPLELGGANNETNYISACRKCNKRKGNRHPEEFINSLDIQESYYSQLKEYVENNGKTATGISIDVSNAFL
jgi:5-methylcytosine-specific restriction endonuclease McrA